MLRAALVGCGPRGMEHARAVQQTAGLNLAGVCDRDPAILAPAIRHLGVPGYHSLAELADRTHPHLVIIATPPQIRRTVVEQAAGFPGVKAIVVEKPMALSLPDAHAMLECCASRGVMLVVGHQLRHAPEFIALQQAIDAGAIGNLDFLRGVCYGNILNQGIHLIDLMRWLTGRNVRWVMSQQCNDAELLRRFDGGEQPFTADCSHPAPVWMTHHFGFDGGAQATLETGPLYSRSRAFAGDWLQKRILAIGSDGLAESQAASHCRVLRAGQPWHHRAFTRADYDRATGVFYEELASAMHGDTLHRNDARDAILSLEAALACVQSAATGDLCTLPLDAAARHAPAATEVTGAPHRLAMSPAAPKAPEFSIVIPLPDHRGMALRCVESFTRHQIYPRDQFELVLLTDGSDPALDAKIRELLGPQDRLLTHATDNETLLYDLGARAARGKFLLFSEPHCIAEPQCLAELAHYLATHAVDGACLRSIGISPNWTAQLEERLYNQGFADYYGRPGDWRKVILRGIAIDREVYLASGGFEHQFGRFAEWALAAKLHAQGRRLGYAAGAAVQHLYTTSMRQLIPHVTCFSAGEMRFHDQRPAEHCQRYFGLPTEWMDRHKYDPAVAKLLGRAVGRRLWRWSEWAEKGRQAWTRLRHSFTTWFGWAGQRWAARWAMRWGMLRCWMLRDDASYWHMYEQIIRLGRIHGLEQCCRPVPPALTATGVHQISALPADALVGFHGFESFQGDVFRWASAAAALPVALPAGSYEMTFDTRGVDRAQTWRTLQVCLDGEPIPCEMDAGLERLRVRFVVPPENDRVTSWLTMTFRPLRPWQKGRPDDMRELGMPIFSIGVERVDEAALVFATRVRAMTATESQEADAAVVTAIQAARSAL